MRQTFYESKILRENFHFIFLPRECYYLWFMKFLSQEREKYHEYSHRVNQSLE